MQNFEADIPYPVSLQAFKKMLESRAYLLEKYTWLGEDNVEILSCEERNGVFHVEIRRIVPIEVPRFARSFLSPKSHVWEKDDWHIFNDELLEGHWAVEVKKAPFRMQGTMRVEPSEKGCLQRVRGEVESSIPLLGNRLERFIAEDAKRKIEREGEFNRQWLINHKENG